ncbi:diaminopimelate epimerase [Desulfovibrio sp. ZJ369]|uniref:diaminopimelate epimerase n=1 Tax=Desulfovibrio sp. ZJ369 TaxID=2709793 RepID=UPI0013EA827A|nr:diaminopimelate epimerase [Desulfovibrio sp. ZJ369]
MSAGVRFTKMQGIGNDYVYINGFEERVDNPHELAARISDRHFGVGSDGLVLILPSATADVRMRMFNADGSEAEMCGNATRCVGKFAHDHGIVKKDVIRLETAAGIKIVRLLFEAGQVCGATVDMGEPVLAPERIPLRLSSAPAAGEDAQRFISRPVEVGGTTYAITAVSMGNPHAVVFMQGIDDLDLPKLGPLFEHHPLFPQRTNTEFVEVLSSTRIRMRVWERGAGETLACGTGACAAAVACALNGYTGRSPDVELRGGVLHIDWDKSDDHVYMTGGATTVFEGVYFI